jgi:hypothetical protein
VFADLYTRAAFSGRWSLPDEYFHSGEIEGQVIAKALRFFSDFTPLFLALFFLALAERGSAERRYWKACIAAVLLLMFVPPVRLFAAQHLGFGLSRGNNFLLYPVLVPACVLAAHAADGLFRGGLSRARVHAVFAFGVLPFYLVKWVVVPLWIRGKGDGFTIEPVLTDALMIGAAYLFFLTRNRVIFVLLVFAAVFGEVRLKTQPLEAIERGSAIVERIRSETAGGARYAFIGDKGELLPPNMESLAGLRSIHSYDSLSSRHYQDLVGRLSEEGTTTFGRIFNKISSDARLGDDAFTYTGISLFISRGELSAERLKKIGELNGYKFYRPAWPARLEAQTADFSETDSGVALQGPLEDHAVFPVVRTASLDDEIIFRVSPLERESVLFVSQQFHPFWRARSDEKDLKTARVNDFYLGVLLPPGTERVNVKFKPFSLWMWVPQAFFVLAALGWGVRRIT